MNIHAELHRLWRLSFKACRLCPIEKVFTGAVPDHYIDADGKRRDLDAPYMKLWAADGEVDGGTSKTIKMVYLVQFSCYSGRRDEAENLRNFVRDYYEDLNLYIGGLTETFQDISMDAPGELDPVDGVYELFQRFTIETAISRPRRKGV